MILLLGIIIGAVLQYLLDSHMIMKYYQEELHELDELQEELHQDDRPDKSEIISE